MITVPVIVAVENTSIPVSVSASESDNSVSISSSYQIPKAYDGNYHITPSRQIQELPTSGLRMRENLIVEPIPQNYGLITWNGSFLTVS